MTTLKPEPTTRDIDGPWLRQSWDDLVFQVHREAFRSKKLFSRERARIWRKSWLYLGHESEVPKPGDYTVRNVGGVPVILQS